MRTLLPNNRGSILPAVLVIVFSLSLSIMIALAFATTSGMGRASRGHGGIRGRHRCWLP
ncbi:MAG: hypothetical protein H0W20_10465 [Chthoniobacterales bacterium]|nr:hypothetical protein [Chthoniobacterales bacterium]